MRQEVFCAKYTTDLEELEAIIGEAKEKGATMIVKEGGCPGVPWDFEWYRFYRVVSEEEQLTKQRAELKQQLNDIENKLLLKAIP